MPVVMVTTSDGQTHEVEGRIAAFILLALKAEPVLTCSLKGSATYHYAGESVHLIPGPILTLD
jgi:hypothetical protein